MITVDQALEFIRNHAATLPAQVVAADRALGLILAEDIASDVDSPPHDKAMVDGYAVIAEDLAGGSAELEVLEEVMAGQVPTKTLTRGRATQIMTGAPVPDGADAVVMVERTESLDGGSRVRVADEQLTAGRNILRRATSLSKDQVVLKTGCELRHIELGVLAEVGCTEVTAIPHPSVAILPTGDELVPPGEQLAAGQIRNSNGPMLTAAVWRAGADAVELEIARDDETAMRRLIEQGLTHDVLVLSGGVSAGVKDLVPKVLTELGVVEVFHKVRLKPGKPIWFGVAERGDSTTLVFGLPGNPVGSLVCFELFVRPALARLAGRATKGLRSVKTELSTDFTHRGDRPTYFPARLSMDENGTHHVQPIRWHGSADLASLAEADALIAFEPGDREYAARQVVDVLLL